MGRDAFNAGRSGPSRCEDRIAKLGGSTGELNFFHDASHSRVVASCSSERGNATAERGTSFRGDTRRDVSAPNSSETTLPCSHGVLILLRARRSGSQQSNHDELFGGDQLQSTPTKPV